MRTHICSMYNITIQLFVNLPQPVGGGRFRCRKCFHFSGVGQVWAHTQIDERPASEVTLRNMKKNIKNIKNNNISIHAQK